MCYVTCAHLYSGFCRTLIQAQTQQPCSTEPRSSIFGKVVYSLNKTGQKQTQLTNTQTSYNSDSGKNFPCQTTEKCFEKNFKGKPTKKYLKSLLYSSDYNMKGL